MPPLSVPPHLSIEKLTCPCVPAKYLPKVCSGKINSAALCTITCKINKKNGGKLTFTSIFEFLYCLKLSAGKFLAAGAKHIVNHLVDTPLRIPAPLLASAGIIHDIRP